MNASIYLLERVVRSVVGIHSRIPGSHVSAIVGLGTERRCTGAIISPEGLIVTVNYALMGAADVVVTLSAGEQVPAQVIASDYYSGLGLLKIPGENLPCLTPVSSQQSAVGEDVFTVSATFNEGRCADSGLITQIGSFDALWEFVLDRCIITSVFATGVEGRAPATLGGPLCNTRGEMLGVSYLNMPEIGRTLLAIPADYFLSHRDELLTHGRRTSAAPQAWLGLLSYTLREHVVIAGVMPGGPSDKAGLKPGDVVLTVDGRDISERRALYDAFRSHAPGESIKIKIFRNNQIQSYSIAAISAEDYFT